MPRAIEASLANLGAGLSKSDERIKPGSVEKSGVGNMAKQEHNMRQQQKKTDKQVDLYVCNPKEVFPMDSSIIVPLYFGRGRRKASQ